METKHQPLELERLKELRIPIQKVKLIHREKLSRLDKLALFVTEHVGSMGFFFIVLGWTVGWLLWNLLAPRPLRFDPYPAFVLWLFISNMIQLFLMPLIMVGQNLQSAHAEAREEAEFELDIKAEREIETILQHLENQNEVLTRIENLLESKTGERREP